MLHVTEARPDTLYTAIMLMLGKIYEGRIFADGPETVRQMQGLQLQKLILLVTKIDIAKFKIKITSTRLRLPSYSNQLANQV